MRRTMRGTLTVLMVSMAVLTLVSCAKVPTVREGGAAKPAATGPRGLSKKTSLRDYVRHKDGAFRWKLLSKARAEGATMYVLDMTSQRWRSAKERCGRMILPSRRA